MLAYLDRLREGKNLLAFSGGTDSSLLFHLLVKEGIEFDIAIVNYNTRGMSELEELYARDLSSQYDKKCYIKSVKLKGTSNFEKVARDIRFEFFEEVISEGGYTNLITGHNLNDKLEWFLMQLTKGAGLKELFGMEGVYDKGAYFIVRPMIKMDKESILTQLKECDVKFFEDESNKEDIHLRNTFRSKYSNDLMISYSKGIRKTFDILETELEGTNIEILYEDSESMISTIASGNQVSSADQLSKKFGYLFSGAQRREFEARKTIVFTKGLGQYCISLFMDKFLILTPYRNAVVMSKDFKELSRKYGLPANNRPYMFLHKAFLEHVKNLNEGGLS